jgi:DNA-binding NtrC family response regulator
VQINLPPLRDRRDDIPYLTAAFIKEFATRFGKPLGGVSPSVERLLHDAPWPGNVRELRNVIERACMLSDGRILHERELISVLGGAARRPAPPPAVRYPQTPDLHPAPGLDRPTVAKVLQQVGGNRSAAARMLRISRRALYRRLDSFGLR